MIYYLKRYRFFIMIGLLIIGGIILINKNNVLDPKVEEIAERDEPPELANAALDEEIDVEDSLVTIDMKGAVYDPGVYQVDHTARVVDVIQLAGGLTQEADEKQINLALRVHDEMLIYVPSKGDTNLDFPLMQTDQGTDTDQVRINTATLEELQTLNGVGPSKAQAILDYIAENGPLTEMDDLLKIGGIGEKTLENFKENIIVP